MFVREVKLRRFESGAKMLELLEWLIAKSRDSHKPMKGAALSEKSHFWHSVVCIEIRNFRLTNAMQADLAECEHDPLPTSTALY
jgi:hypothetical protein